MLSFSKNKIFILFLCLSLLTNSKFILHFRFADIAFLVMFLTYGSFIRVNKFSLLLILSIFLLALISSTYNFSGGGNYNELVFYYKYFFLFCVLIWFSSYSNYSSKLKNINYDYYVLAILLYLVSYVFIFVYSNMGMALGGATRVSIPFSSLDPGTSNAPAFSLIFALLFIYCDKNFNGILKGVLLLLTVSALVMCGSRSGIFIIVMYFLLFRGSVKSTIFLFVPIIILMFVVLSQTYNSESLVFKLVERALDFELNTDESANQRVFKQLSAFISTEEQFFLLGKGHENTAIVWYDGLIGNLQTFGGLISIILFYSSYLVLRRVRPEYFIFFDLLLLASFISEYALTSYVLVMVLFLSISSIHSKLRLV